MFWNMSEKATVVTAAKLKESHTVPGNGRLPGNTKATADEFNHQSMRGCPDLSAQLANLDTDSTERMKSNHQLDKDRM